MDPLSQTTPEFVFNFDVTQASAWKHVAVREIPACSLDPGLAGHSAIASMYEVLSKDWILPSVVSTGVYVTDPQLKFILGSIGAGLPKKPGSGKDGSITKCDRAKHLACFLFPEAGEREIANIVQGLMGWSQKKVDLTLLSHIAELDPENADSFRKDVEVAMREFTQEVLRRGQADEKATAQEKERQAKQAEQEAKDSELEMQKGVDAKAAAAWNSTPEDLRKLLPGEGEIRGVFGIYYAASQNHFRAVYPLGPTTRATLITVYLRFI